MVNEAEVALVMQTVNAMVLAEALSEHLAFLFAEAAEGQIQVDQRQLRNTFRHAARDNRFTA